MIITPMPPIIQAACCKMENIFVCNQVAHFINENSFFILQCISFSLSQLTLMIRILLSRKIWNLFKTLFSETNSSFFPDMSFLFLSTISNQLACSSIFLMVLPLFKSGISFCPAEIPFCTKFYHYVICENKRRFLGELKIPTFIDYLKCTNK